MNTPGQRVGQIVRKAWPEGQRQAARELGVGQASISRVINNQRLPSFELLNALVRQTGVCGDWLLTGKGDPFPEEKQSVAVGGLPLARDFLPLPCIDHFAGLPRFAFPELDELRTGFRYILQLSKSNPAVQTFDAALAPGDLLVLDTDSSRWLADVSQLRPSRLCVVSVRVRSAQRHELGRIMEGVEDLPGTLVVETCAHGEVRIQVSGESRPGRGYWKPDRRVEVGNAPVEDRPTVALTALALFVWRAV